MLVRLISGTAYVALLLAAAFQGGPWWPGLVVLMALLAVGEAYAIERRAGRRPCTPVGFVLAPALALALLPGLAMLGSIALALAAILSLSAQVLRPEARRSTPDWASTLGHPVYLGSLLAFLAALRGLGEGGAAGLAWLLLLLTTIWINDSGAYLGGRLLGRRPFFPSISPRKTLEGFVSGSLSGLLAALALPAAAGRLPALEPLAAVPTWALLVLGLGVAVLGPAGDLSASVLKRQAGVKDSGRLIPGHGGVLDRIDSLLFAAPLAYLLARWLVG